MAGLLSITKYDGVVKSDSYIVILMGRVARISHLSWLEQNVPPSDFTVTHAECGTDFLNGYAGKFTESALNALRASPDVESMEEDGTSSTEATTTQSVKSLLSVLTMLSEKGATFGGGKDTDTDGHGTHVAGTAAGTRYGVAKKANLIAVKVFPDSGDAHNSDIISGLDWVHKQVQATGRPSVASVANLSFGGRIQKALDNAVESLTKARIHVTAASSKKGRDAKYTSPARVASANTIAATTVGDEWHEKSNYGPCVDLLALEKILLAPILAARMPRPPKAGLRWPLPMSQVSLPITLPVSSASRVKTRRPPT